MSATSPFFWDSRAASALIARRRADQPPCAFASPSAFVVAQSALADTHQTLIIAQGQHRAVLEAVAAGASARADKLAREHSNLAKRSLHGAAAREAPLRKTAGGNFLRLQLAAV